jgi:hypothetical protein
MHSAPPRSAFPDGAFESRTSGIAQGDAWLIILASANAARAIYRFHLSLCVPIADLTRPLLR